MMKLFKLSIEPKAIGAFEAAVVVAEDEYNAVRIHPDGKSIWDNDKNAWLGTSANSSWRPIDKITCTYLGEEKIGLSRGVIVCAYDECI